MDACVFSGYMSVLVNGRVTKDFVVEMRLRHGDPLFPFSLSWLWRA